VSTAAVLEDSDEGRRVREAVARAADVHHRKSHEMRGIEQGYRYVGSPVIEYAGGDEDDGYSYTYEPSAAPGYRLPHVWLDDGAALHDRLGDGFTLLRLAGTRADTSALERALAEAGAPLDVLTRPEPRLREAYGADLLLLRPDLHVAWRGDAAPQDPGELAAALAGHRVAAPVR
jgi:hypothetical protein